MATIIRTVAATLIAVAMSGCAAVGTPDALGQTEGQGVVTGQVAYRERIALPPDAVLRVELQDVSLADTAARTIALEERRVGARQVPLPFELSFGARSLTARGRYAVRATIRDAAGALLWTTDTVHRVEPGRATQDLGTLRLVQVQPPSATAVDRLSDQEWVVEDVGGRGLIDSARLTLGFAPDGRLSGLAGCNSFTGSYSVEAQTLTIGQLATTRKLCAPALMDLERSFVGVLSIATSFRIDATGALILSTLGGVTITAR